jgi:hypothetical protein
MAPQVETYLEIASQLKVELGDFMAGFDLVGQEDKGKPLIDFVPLFLEKLNGSDLKLFFHAGETDWWVSPTPFVYHFYFRITALFQSTFWNSELFIFMLLNPIPTR